ncbi:hypothetical protein [Segnochrobactrum spirostomi]|uniref:DUF2163 domain-containing protein n=1 Tax=Segnochrobactrum spirostomi TaxID=2608987 RepID=A0A6A7Y4I1_9HYPH|nr:hypothetical protein [Segnochrobactrum spirostomi]MQT13636.1 hypothetical protein [Segnochrobactrum spirostomi]
MRRFIWSETRKFDGTPDPIGFWDDVDNVSISGRTYYGSGTLFSVSGRTTTMNGSIPTLTITLSQISSAVSLMARGQDMTNARLEYLIGVFDVETDPNQLIDGLVTRFRGRITAARIDEPEAGGKGAITITAKGAGHQLTMASTARRSDAAMRRRDPNDTYSQYTGALKGIDIAFGTSRSVK